MFVKQVSSSICLAVLLVTVIGGVHALSHGRREESYTEMLQHVASSVRELEHDNPGFSRKEVEEIKAIMREKTHPQKPSVVFEEAPLVDSLGNSLQKSTKNIPALVEEEEETELQGEVIAGLLNPKQASKRRQRSEKLRAKRKLDQIDRVLLETREALGEKENAKESQAAAEATITSSKSQSDTSTETKTPLKLPEPYRMNEQHMIEDCMGCRLVWKQVEMDVANARYSEDVAASFQRNCADSQKSDIFYKVCEDMFDVQQTMVDDYMSGKYTVNQMCQRVNICMSLRRYQEIMIEGRADDNNGQK